MADVLAQSLAWLLGLDMIERIYLARSDLHSVPVDSWQDVDEEFRVVGDVVLLELSILVVKRKAEG